MASTTPFPTSDSVPGGGAGRAADATSSTATTGGDSVNRLVQGAHHVVDRVAEKAIPAVDRAKATYEDASAQMKARADELSRLQAQWTDDARTCVRDHPLTSVAAAFAAGLVLSRLLR